MNDVFTLVHKDYDKVVLKVNAEDNLVIAMNPYISGDMDYITITRGKNHILTIIKKDGSTFSFHWGYGGYTLISKNLEVLKRKVVAFIEEDCKIMLELTEEPYEASIFFNNNFDKWQLQINNNYNIWSNTARTLEDMKEWCKDFVKARNWKHGIAQTGIDIWDAVM